MEANARKPSICQMEAGVWAPGQPDLQSTIQDYHKTITRVQDPFSKKRIMSYKDKSKIPLYKAQLLVKPIH